MIDDERKFDLSTAVFHCGLSAMDALQAKLCHSGKRAGATR